MVQTLLKTLFISILCGSILLLDFAHKGHLLGIQMNSARAESVKTGGDDDMVVGVGFSGPITSDLASTLTMVGISIMASRLILYGKVTPDILIAAAGGVAFMGGDMMATAELKKAKKEITTEIQRNEKGEISDEQRQSILRMIKMYEASKKAANTKKMLQMAAGVAFMAAAAMAFVQATTEMTAMTNCLASINTLSTTEISTTSTTCETVALCPAAQADNAKCQTALTALQANLAAYTSGRTPPQPSCSAMPAVSALRSTASGGVTGTPAACTLSAEAAAVVGTSCNAMFGMHLGYETGCLQVSVLVQAVVGLALLAAMGITADGIIAALVGFIEPLGNIVDTAIFIPQRRAIVWGVLGALALAASMSTSNVITQIDGDIKKLQGLLNVFESQANGTVAKDTNKSKDNSSKTSTLESPKLSDIGLQGTGSAIANGNKNGTYSDLSVENAKMPCVTSNDAGNCGSFSDLLNSKSKNSNLPAGLNDTVFNIAQMADGFNGASKISNGAMIAASNVAGSLRAINGVLKNAKAAYKKNLFAKKVKDNLDTEEDEVKNLINKEFNKAFVEKGKFNQAKLVSALGKGSPFGDVRKDVEADLKKIYESNKKLPKIKFSDDFMMSPPPSKGDHSDSGLKDDKAENSNTSSKDAVNAANSSDEYEIKNDVNLNSKENLFDVISNRYQKSAYPRLFKRVQ